MTRTTLTLMALTLLAGCTGQLDTPVETPAEAPARAVPQFASPEEAPEQRAEHPAEERAPEPAEEPAEEPTATSAEERTVISAPPEQPEGRDDASGQADETVDEEIVEAQPTEEPEPEAQPDPEPEPACVEGQPCDDGHACTVAEICWGGECLSSWIETDDGNPCTFDSCHPTDGVTHVAILSACDDGDPCTVEDTCVVGSCESGPSLDCDDDDLCTIDACAPGIGCFSQPDDAYCDDGDACTIDSCHPKAGCQTAPVQSHACRPAITVAWPPRAATIEGDFAQAEITVTGEVYSGAGAIVALELNDEPVQLNGQGGFAVTVPATVGGNMLVFTAVDDKGNKTRRVQSYHWSPVFFAPDQPVMDALAVFLGPAVFDALNAAAAQAAGAIDLAAAIPNPLYTGSTHEIYAQNIQHGAPVATITPTWGGFNLHLSMANFHAVLKAEGQDMICLGNPFGGSPKCLEYLDITGWLDIDKIEINATFAVSIQDGIPQASLQNIDLELTGMDIAINSLLGGLINPILDLVVMLLDDTIENAFEDSVADALSETVEDALKPLSWSKSLDEPVAMTVTAGFSEAIAEPSGLTMTLSLLTETDPVVGADSPGSLGRAGCGAGPEALVIPGEATIELALSDDAINRVLWTAWRAGMLEMKDTVELESLESFGFGPVDVTVSALLPPVLQSCGDDVTVSLGELLIEAHTNVNGLPMDLTLHVSLAAGFNLHPDGDELKIELTYVHSLDWDAVVEQDNMLGWQTLLSNTIAEHAVPEVMAAFESKTMGFALPTVALPTGDKVLKTQSITRIDGNTVVAGELE